jgi:hypothetical protein
MPSAPLTPPSDVFCVPQPVESLDGCFFTHAIDLPGYGTMPGQWDMRGGVEDCLGFVAVDGKRVLHVGCDSGFLGFEMEKRGAEVVRLDGTAGGSWDVVPFARPDGASARPGLDQHLAAIARAYWFSHRALASRIRLARGTAYAIPDLVGPADVAVLDHALPRLRDPFRGLHAAARFARETMIVTDLLRAPGAPAGRVGHVVAPRARDRAGDAGDPRLRGIRRASPPPAPSRRRARLLHGRRAPYGSDQRGPGRVTTARESGRACGER